MHLGKLSSLLGLAVCLASFDFGGCRVSGSQRVGQYVDRQTAVVKSPEGFAGNDDCWRTSWCYACLVIIHEKDQRLYERLKTEHNLDISLVKKFLDYFHDNCVRDDGWRRATTLSPDFSRDQLVPLLYLLACVKEYGADDVQPVAKAVLADLVRLVKKHGAVSRTPGGKVGGNLRYVIDVLGDRSGVSLVGGTVRSLHKAEFSAALRAHSLLVQLPSDDLATRDDYSVFNSLALVTLQCVVWGASDGDVRDWRANYRQHADKGWGPAFRIVSGRSLDDNEIEKYYSAHIKGDQDNDIIMGQRPHKYLSGHFPQPQFGQSGASGEWLVLDYVILKGLQLAWR